MARPNSKAAYTLVDLNGLDAETRKQILDDADAGGGEYGIRVVEEVVNGPARAPIYGYYDHDEEKWSAAKKELKIGSKGVDDAEVGTVTDVTDARTEAALRAAAEAKAGAVADSVRAMDEAEVRKVLEGEDAPYIPAQAQLRAEPMSNVDATLVKDPAADKPTGNKANKAK